MNKKILFAVAAAIALGLGGVASADTLDIASSPDSSAAWSATSITFSGEASVGPVSGIFSVLSTCSDCLALTNFTSTTAAFTLFTDGAATVMLNADPTFTVSGGVLGVTDGGTFTDGAISTPIEFQLSTQGPGTSGVSYSIGITATPLPSTWTMLIASLLGLGLFAYRGSKKRSHGVSILAA